MIRFCKYWGVWGFVPIVLITLINFTFKPSTTTTTYLITLQLFLLISQIVAGIIYHNHIKKQLN